MGVGITHTADRVIASGFITGPNLPLKTSLLIGSGMVLIGLGMVTGWGCFKFGAHRNEERVIKALEAISKTVQSLPSLPENKAQATAKGAAPKVFNTAYPE